MIYVLPFGFFIIAFALVYEMIVPSLKSALAML